MGRIDHSCHDGSSIGLVTFAAVESRVTLYRRSVAEFGHIWSVVDDGPSGAKDGTSLELRREGVTMRAGIISSVLRRGGWLLLAAALALPAPLLAPPTARASILDRVVNTVEDSDDGACGPLPAGDCTLREATNAANLSGGKDTIVFAIPGEGVQTIRPATPLPILTEAVIIDGYTQPGAQENTAVTGTNAVLLIEIDGGAITTTATGLDDRRGEGSVFRGLVINNFEFGIVVRPRASPDSTIIEGNFLGTDPSGTTAKPNSAGIYIDSGDTTTHVRIGGSAPATRNLIAGNGRGIDLFSTSYVVQRNLIGTDRSGARPLGNGTGIQVFHGSGIILDNVIAFSNTIGVVVSFEAGPNHRIDRNAIFGSVDLGIDLHQDGPTPNDAGDVDVGANDLQNYPVLTAATTSGGTTTVTGSLNSLPNRQFLIQFFANPTADDAEGQTYLGEKEVSTDASGNTEFSFSVTQPLAGQAITATATHVTIEMPANTSEFSPPVTAPKAPPSADEPQNGQGAQAPANEQGKQDQKKKKKGKNGKKGKSKGKGKGKKGKHRDVQVSGAEAGTNAKGTAQPDKRGTRTDRHHAGTRAGKRHGDRNRANR
jgi:CSLREA domain-containing protein